ncbi:MAG: hypothetical protein M3525_14890 [Acidobacteriota bacterium]|nr:hypothetical protein [Acidobacteriota bacterium]
MANGIVNILTEKIFPSNAPGNQTESGNLKALLFSPPITKGEADAALNQITGQFIAGQDSAGKISAAANPVDDNAAPKKTVGDFLAEIMRRQPVKTNDDNQSKIQIPMRPDKSPERMTRADYTRAFRRAVYEKAMPGVKLTNEEIRLADKALIDSGLYATGYNLHGTMQSLRNLQKHYGDTMPVSAGRQNLEYASRAGEAVLQFQEYQAAQSDAVREKARNEVN